MSSAMQKITPQTFALEERTQQGLVIFKVLKTKVKFSISLGVNVDMSMFLQESFNRQESGYLLSAKVLKKCGLKIKSGAIVSIEGEKEEAYLLLKSEEGVKKLKVSILELLGLWSVKNFTLHASKQLIETCRDVTIQIKSTESPLESGMHKKYGQKYLM